nr:MAG TPA: hypothetical protein [Crassvirales sp.]
MTLKLNTSKNKANTKLVLFFIKKNGKYRRAWSRSQARKLKHRKTHERYSGKDKRE